MRGDRPTIRKIAAFAGLPDEVVRRIESQCEWLDIPSHKPLVDQRSSDDSVYFLVSGKATAQMVTPSSRTVALCELSDGDMFGELSAIDGLPRSASVVADLPCVVARMEGATFREIMLGEPRLMHAMLGHLTAMIRTLTARVFELSVLAVPARLQAELLRIALESEVSGDTAFVPRLPTHTELANRIATAREVVSREIGRLDRMGLIERRGSSMRVPSLARLDEIVRAAAGDGDDRS